jgi:hypothetical protein
LTPTLAWPGSTLSRVSFVDAYALTGLACFIASADRDGLSVELVLPEHPDVRSWLSRMHLGAVIDAFGATSARGFRGWANVTGETP